MMLLTEKDKSQRIYANEEAKPLQNDNEKSIDLTQDYASTQTLGLHSALTLLRDE